MNKELKAIHFQGVRPDSLGNYFVGLGLLAAVSKKYPQIRGCWRDGHFVLLGEGSSEIKNYLLNEWQPTSYVRWWSDGQKKDTKAQTDESIWQGRNRETNANQVRLLDAHIIGSGRNQFNHLFGTGGNIGKRDLAKTSKDAWQLIQKDKSQEKTAWLEQTLYEKTNGTLPKLNNTGTWFVYANKTFSSGQEWYREGEISPWSFLLALEGALLFVGGVNRRLGSRSRAYAVFPFLTEPPSPKTENEVGYVRAELWTPIWSNPTNLSELRNLLERGLARIGERAAKTPHEYAMATMKAGVDTGVESFARFVLRQTTSSQVYEAIPKEKIAVSKKSSDESKLIEPLLSWLDRLPYEPTDKKQKGKFKGLRGRVEEGIIRLAANPNDAERWRHLWLLLPDIQNKIDKNKNLRVANRALPWLDEAWFEKAWGNTPPDEIQVARAVSSIGAGTNAPLLGNIFGVEQDKYKKIAFVGEQRPQKVVWNNGDLTDGFLALLQRRLIDAEKDAESDVPKLPFNFGQTCSPEVLTAFLNKSLDYEMIGQWIPAFSLVKWTRQSFDSEETPDTENQNFVTDGAYLLQALFRPIFCPFDLELDGKELFPGHLKPRVIVARRLLNLIRQNAWDEAMQLVKSRYLAAGRAVISHPAIEYADGETIASALLVPLSPKEIIKGLRRWLKPEKNSKYTEKSK
jgi:CRISPR-associated protein Csx17